MSKDIVRKLVRESLEQLSEEQEIEKVTQGLFDEFDKEKIPLERENDWYCGVTGQGVRSDGLKLERIGDHYGDGFPELAINTIVCIEVSTVKVAMAVELMMKDKHGLDIGQRQNEPKDGNQIWVYIFRKIDEEK